MFKLTFEGKLRNRHVDEHPIRTVCHKLSRVLSIVIKA